MAWFGDSLSGLSHLKGQITNFTKEVLSEGIVKEIDDQTMQLKEANERCIQLQELLDTKDAEKGKQKRAHRVVRCVPIPPPPLPSPSPSPQPSPPPPDFLL
ncbi:thyroid receptor-interacting protein 11 isoform X3 [Vespula squamosa]|uniref:Thyroid receptor-interacting protein 11 isoform X3 n=1 Tax=Vespula squamosa TaxID=30214 RepID=A0ABD2C1H2_VESSQ